MLGLIVLIVTLGGSNRRIGTRTFVWRAFLIDPATDTYSLSKLQFHAWSVAALLSYIYLSLSRCLVQGKLDIADIPENLPWTWGVSAGTAVLSVTIAQWSTCSPRFPRLSGQSCAEGVE